MNDMHSFPPSSLPHLSNLPSSSTLNSTYSNVSALFEAAVLSQLAIILKNQEEVKSRISNLERNLAHVTAHRLKATPQPFPVHSYSIASQAINNSVPQPFPVQAPIVSQAINNSIVQKSTVHATHSVPQVSINSPITTHPTSIISQTSVGSIDKLFDAHSINKLFDVHDDSMESQTINISIDQQPNTTIVSDGRDSIQQLSAINSESIASQTITDSIQQPFVVYGCPVKYSPIKNSTHQQSVINITPSVSQCNNLVQQLNVIPCTSTASHLNKDTIQENVTQDIPMSTEDLIQQSLDIHGVSTVPETVKGSFQQNVPIYTTQTVKQPLSQQNSICTPFYRSTIPCVIKEEPKHFHFSFTHLQYAKGNSISVPNFARKLAEEIFTVQEFQESNCTGAKGKRRLDPERLGRIKKAVFETYDIAVEEQKTVWQQCQNAINTFARRKMPKYNCF